MFGNLSDIPYAVPMVLAFFVSFVVTVAVTPLAKRFATKIGAVDKPGPRRVNKVPVPRMGGIAVFAGAILATAIVLYGTHYLNWPLRLSMFHGSQVRPIWYFVSLAGIFATGLVDDKYHLSPGQKLIGQVLAATIATCSGLRISEIVIPGHDMLIDLGILSYPATIVFLVAYTNVFNLIDGLDGLASGVACIASATMFIIATMSGHMDAAMQALVLCSAALGFLVYNFHPASVFLGDSGSLFIGFMMGCVSLMSVSRVSGFTTIIVPLIISGIPIMDTLSAIIRRKRANVSIGSADAGHLHHRLLDSGYDQSQAVLFIYAWTFFLCLGAVTMTQIGTAQRIAVFLILIGMSALMGMNLKLFRPILVHRNRDARRSERRSAREARHMRSSSNRESRPATRHAGAPRHMAPSPLSTAGASSADGIEEVA